GAARSSSVDGPPPQPSPKGGRGSKGGPPSWRGLRRVGARHAVPSPRQGPGVRERPPPPTPPPIQGEGRRATQQSGARIGARAAHTGRRADTAVCPYA